MTDTTDRGKKVAVVGVVLGVVLLVGAIALPTQTVTKCPDGPNVDKPEDCRSVKTGEHPLKVPLTLGGLGTVVVGLLAVRRVKADEASS